MLKAAGQTKKRANIIETQALEDPTLGGCLAAMFLQSETGSENQEGFVTNMITDSDDIEFYNTWTVGSKPLTWQAGTVITCLICIQGYPTRIRPATGYPDLNWSVILFSP